MSESCERQGNTLPVGSSCSSARQTCEITIRDALSGKGLVLTGTDGVGFCDLSLESASVNWNLLFAGTDCAACSNEAISSFKRSSDNWPSGCISQPTDALVS